VNGVRLDPTLPEAPHAALRAAVTRAAGRLAAAGQVDAARELSAALDTWWRAQQDWTAGLTRQLGVHHDINNALVGVRGNAQLLTMGPAGAVPGVRERLEVVLRESDRIRDAAQHLHALKSALAAQARDSGPEGVSRAA
jgi:nitrogen-specific signal transduction histidine kinase